ncbi:MAG TPA: hypothetical protein VEC76_10505 [Streptosporangiaceae bacterium]|nr:hypothetical protein [Streptosporangiaceae bacterium]
MTQDKARKTAARQRMAETGEPYSVARRAAQDHQPGTAGPGQVIVRYRLDRTFELEIGADDWAKADSGTRARLLAESGGGSFHPGTTLGELIAQDLDARGASAYTGPASEKPASDWEEEYYADGAASEGITVEEFRAREAGGHADEWSQERADKVQERVQERADRAFERAEQAQERAEQAQERAEQARELAEQAQELADEAREAVEEAREAGDGQAQDRAEQKAERAQQQADRAFERAEQARERAEREQERADREQERAEQEQGRAEQEAELAQERADWEQEQDDWARGHGGPGPHWVSRQVRSIPRPPRPSRLPLPPRPPRPPRPFR